MCWPSSLINEDYLNTFTLVDVLKIVVRMSAFVTASPFVASNNNNNIRDRVLMPQKVVMPCSDH